MLVIPAIDLLDGTCVQLRQGNYEQATEYSQDAAGVARRWQDAGAEWIHVVDLNGAREGEPRHMEALRSIRQSTDLNVEFSGGLRSMASIERALELAHRIVLGTVAVKNPALLGEALAAFGDRVAVGIDARKGIVATDGWEAATTRRALDLGKEMRDLGGKTIIFTSIEVDGTLSGPDLNALAEMRTISGVQLIASGGVGTIAHLRQIAKTGAEGCIVGTALYEGAIDLTRAMHEVDEGAERYEW